MIFASSRPRPHHLSHISSRRTSPDLRTEIPCPPVSICFRESKAGIFLRLASLSGRLVPVFPSPPPPPRLFSARAAPHARGKSGEAVSLDPLRYYASPRPDSATAPPPTAPPLPFRARCVGPTAVVDDRGANTTARLGGGGGAKCAMAVRSCSPQRRRQLATNSRDPHPGTAGALHPPRGSPELAAIVVRRSGGVGGDAASGRCFGHPRPDERLSRELVHPRACDGPPRCAPPHSAPHSPPGGGPRASRRVADACGARRRPRAC